MAGVPGAGQQRAEKRYAQGSARLPGGVQDAARHARVLGAGSSTTTAFIARMASEHRPRMTEPVTTIPSDVPVRGGEQCCSPAASASPVTIGSRGPRRAVSGPLAGRAGANGEAQRQD